MPKYILIAFLLLGGPGPDTEAQTAPDTIPFFLNSQNNLCITARLNRSDTLVLMFHTAATGVTITRDALARLKAQGPQQATSVQTWGGKAEASFSENNQLTISHLHWDSLMVFVDEFSGPDTDGKFGYDLFDGKIVEVDYDRQKVIVHPVMPPLRGYSRMPLLEKQGSLYLEGQLKMGKTVYRDTFMFHSGYGGCILLDPAIGQRYGMQDQLKTISSSELKDAFGNVFKIETKELPSLTLGRQQCRKVPLSFAARSAEIPMKVFGNGLMKRFNLVLDFQGQWLYLRPNSLSKQDFFSKK